jgi:dihydropyrimidinase
MELDCVFKGGQAVTPGGVQQADIGVAQGKIAAIGPDLSAAETVDASGTLVLPGGVDPHAHIEQLSGMGLWTADTFETATRSAALGGTTSVISFAAQGKGQRLRDVVADYTARAERGAMIDHAFHIIVSDVTVPSFDSDLAALIAEGHRSIKVFTTYKIALDDHAILRTMAMAREAGALVCVHAENDGLIQQAKAQLIAEGKTQPKHHALSHPRAAEIEAVTRMCLFAEHLQQPVMLFHISTVEAVEVIRAARARGVPVWAETCPHYLLMTADVLDREGVEGAKWMCSPPQRTEADQEALWQGLEDGTLDLISSDHAPYRFDETGKLSAGPAPRFDQIANGMPGLEPRLSLIFDAMMQRGLSVEQFVRWTAGAAAQIYKLPGKGALQVGADADLVLWDAQHRHTYDADDLHDNVGYNPWAGRSVTGWPVATYLRGRCIARAGALLTEPGQGAWIDRKEGP